MAPQEKTTKEQRKYLWSLMDDYLEVQKQGNFTKFWARLFLAWFKLWPVEEDARIQDEEQRRVAYALAIKEQEGYLRTWFRGRAASKNRTPHGPPTLDVPKLPKATRCLQEVEIYSKKYYATRVAYIVDATFVGKPVPTTNELLAMRRKITQARLDNETPEIKEEISTTHKEALRVRGEQKRVQKEELQPTPECYAAGIKNIEANFKVFSQRVGLDSGWSFTLIAGGPDPMNAGRIKTASFHYGDNVFGLVFSEHEPDFKGKFLPSYANFLQTCYSPEECASRALNRSAPPVQASSPSTSSLDTSSPPDITSPPEVSAPLFEASEPAVPHKVAKGKATTKPKAPKASKASTKPKLVASDTTTVASDTTTIASDTATVASDAATVASNAATVASNQGATWSPGNGLGMFPLLPPDLDFLNNPANFPNTFPLVSNVHMPTTIPSTFVIPPLGNYMSLLDELSGPLPAGVLGVTDQINPYHLATDTMYPTMPGTMPGAMPGTMPGAMSTAPPLPYVYTALPTSPNLVETDGPNAVGGPSGPSTLNAPSTLNGDGPSAVENTGTEANTAGDVPSTVGSATLADNTSADDGSVSSLTTRAPRKRRGEEVDPKFIVEGKRVRRQQVRTEIEALTQKAATEKENAPKPI